MQLRYRFYMGGEWNPYEEEADKALRHLVEERQVKDPKREKPNKEILPMLDSWPAYVLASSKSAFWQGERDICLNSSAKAAEIEELWKEANETGQIGNFIKEIDATEIEKAICFYLASLFQRFNPDNFNVDFRLYFTESPFEYSTNNELTSLEPFE